jgi:hypothetical protein
MARVGELAGTLSLTILVDVVGEVLLLPMEPDGLRLLALVLEVGEI